MVGGFPEGMFDLHSVAVEAEIGLTNTDDGGRQ